MRLRWCNEVVLRTVQGKQRCSAHAITEYQMCLEHTDYRRWDQDQWKAMQARADKETNIPALKVPYSYPALPS